MNTQEIYGYRPASTKVHRITITRLGEQLNPGITSATDPMAVPASADHDYFIHETNNTPAAHRT